LGLTHFIKNHCAEIRKDDQKSVVDYLIKNTCGVMCVVVWGGGVAHTFLG